MHHVVVHAHCYQPPREDPWLEVVENEPSATPDHDWNARIDRECYARLAATEGRVRDPNALPSDPDARAGLARLINLYGWCTFDVGATLCEWLETEAPLTLRAMIEGDAASVRRWGHGNAIAAPYHHVILPLASPRDKRTEVRWGIKDFQRRFGRTPEGFWLPECAADVDTLDVLAQEGIRFTILAPYQVRTNSETHGLPVRWTGAAGRSLTILPYDGGLAGEVAFGGLLQDATALARRLAPVIPDGQARCTTLATDGETFGHHHRRGERTLASALSMIAARSDARLINAAAMVALQPPTLNATLVSPSSWSCAHGIERWRSNCGCRIDQNKPAAQQWRGPLRVALTALAEQCHEIFEHEGRGIFRDAPAAVRDEYGAVVAFDDDRLDTFVRTVVHAEASEAQVQRAHELLEMQRASLRTFTSCAWFFDEIDRIEARQVLRYAARCIELAGDQERLTANLVRHLAAAHAAAPRSVTGADVYTLMALPHADASWRVAAGAIALAAAGTPPTHVESYDVSARESAELANSWVVEVRHRRTGVRHSFRGQTIGEGPAVRVTLHALDEPTSTRQISVADMPESVARLLLAPYALDDAALSDVAVGS